MGFFLSQICILTIICTNIKGPLKAFALISGIWSSNLWKLPLPSDSSYITSPRGRRPLLQDPGRQGWWRPQQAQSQAILRILMPLSCLLSEQREANSELSLLEPSHTVKKASFSFTNSYISFLSLISCPLIKFSHTRRNKTYSMNTVDPIGPSTSRCRVTLPQATHLPLWGSPCCGTEHRGACLF